MQLIALAVIAALVVGCEEAASPAPDGSLSADVPSEGGAPPWGRCGERAARCFCECGAGDVVCARLCTAEVPRCAQCFVGSAMLVCCPSETHGLDECAQSTGCDADKQCLARRCRAELDALQTCWGVATASAQCRRELEVCFGASRAGQSPCWYMQ